MKTGLKNKTFYSFEGIFRSVSLTCASGPLIQTLLSVLGFSTTYIYIFSTIIQAANVISIVLFSRFADKGSIFKRAALVSFVNAVGFLFFLPLCYAKKPSFLVFVLFLLIAVVIAITTGLHTVCAYKIPYYVMRPEEYGRATSLIGIISSVITLLMGAIVSAASKRFEYEYVMIVAFIISAFFVLFSAISVAKLKNITDIPLEVSKENKLSLVKILKEPIFLNLVPANLFRGISAGTITVLATVAIDLGYDESVSAAMVSVQSIATLLGCGIFGWLSYKIFPSKFVWWGSIAFLALPLLLIKNPILFLSICVLVNFGKALVDYGVPAMLIFLVPAEIAGPYNAWRMVLNNGGTLIGTAIAAILPTPALLIVCLVCQFISGLTYLNAKKICGRPRNDKTE